MFHSTKHRYKGNQLPKISGMQQNLFQAFRSYKCIQQVLKPRLDSTHNKDLLLLMLFVAILSTLEQDP